MDYYTSIILSIIKWVIGVLSGNIVQYPKAYFTLRNINLESRCHATMYTKLILVTFKQNFHI